MLFLVLRVPGGETERIIIFWSGEEESRGKAWSRSRLGRAGDGVRELLTWTAGPGAQKNFDPEHPLARDSKGRILALVLFLVV